MVDRIVMDELIGMDVEISRSSRRELIGLKGRVIDETLKILRIEIKDTGREIAVPKKFCVFRFKAGNRVVDVDGRDILFRPEDRIKKYWKKFSMKKRWKHG